MADIQSSIKDLWVVISGNTVLKSDQLVGTELSKNSDQVLNGVLYHSQKGKEPPVVPKDFHPELLSKLSGLLGLDRERSYRLFCSYLLYEYRGTHEDLKAALGSERSIHHVLHEVWNFYYTERLFALFCLKHILEHWQDASHPYAELFCGFLESVDREGAVVKRVTEQLEALTDEPAPTRESRGPYVTSELSARWVEYTLREQCELLQIVLLYYKDAQPKMEDVLQLLAIFQKHGFGRRHPHRGLLGDAHDSVLDLIGHLECLVLLESLDLYGLFKCCSEGAANHHLLKDDVKLRALDAAMSSPSGRRGPLLLGWLLVRTWAPADLPAAPLGRAALRLDPFGRLHELLRHPALQGKSAVAVTAHAVVHDLLRLLVSTFDLHTLGPLEPLFTLCEELFSYGPVARAFWNETTARLLVQSEESGLGPLFVEAKRAFPLEPGPLLRMSASLAGADEESALKVAEDLREVPFFTEAYADVDPRETSVSADGESVRLVSSRFPYGSGSVVLPSGTRGVLLASGGSSVVRWEARVNGWQVCLLEMAKPREMNEAWLQKVLHIARLLRNLLESSPGAHDSLVHFVEPVFAVLERLRTSTCPPVEVLGECLAVVAVLARRNPVPAWGRLVQTGLLPALAARPRSSAELAKGHLVTESTLSRAMASQERVVGRHPVCLAFLDLLAAVAETFVQRVQEDYLACLVVVLQDIFPSYHRWPYVAVSDRELVGRRCLLVFHELVTLTDTFRAEALGSCELCVYGLLHGDAGQALLRLVLAGEASVNRAIEFEGSRQSEDLLMSVRLGFSLLNRLLLLGAAVASRTPLERRLLESPAQSASTSVVASLAHFAYLRFEPRLCTLALQLLGRIAKLYPMSLLACLGPAAEGFRDQVLLRLGKLTEDAGLKVAVLRLLAVCIASQPGVSQLFLGESAQDEACPCLEAVLNVLKLKKERAYHCPTDLHRAAVEVVHAIWACHQLRAMEYLKKNKDFWNLLCFPLTEESAGPRDPLLAAFVVRTLALELYHSRRALDPQMSAIFEKAREERSVQRWSKMVHEGLPRRSDADVSAYLRDVDESCGSSADALALLAAWRDLCTVIAKCPHVSLPVAAKEAVLRDVALGLESDEILEKPKISILLGELYLILLNQWGGECTKAVSTWYEGCERLFTTLATGATALHPRLVLLSAAIASATVRILGRGGSPPDKDAAASDRLRLIRPVCALLKYYGRKSTDELDSASPTSVQVCTILVVLLKDAITTEDVASSCLTTLREFSVIPILADVLCVSLRVSREPRIALAICHLFLSLASVPQLAEALQASGVVGRASPVLASCYARGTGQAHLEVYRQFVRLVAGLLHTLRHFFVRDALSFVAVHQERLHSCLVGIRENPTNVREALATCCLAYGLAAFRHVWVSDGSDPVAVLVRGVYSATSAATAYLWRPSLLQHTIEYKKGSTIRSSPEEEGDRPRRQPSTDEVPDPSPRLTEAKKELLELLAVCLLCCQRFGPGVAETVSDQGLDVDQWQPIVRLSFSSPSLERDDGLTFGTLLAAAHLSLKSLTKGDRLHSPAGARPSSDRERCSLLLILEVSLSVSVAQAILCRLHPDVPPREKQLLSRELGAEVSSVKMQVQRHLKRGMPASPSGSRGTPQGAPDPGSEWELVHLFVRLVDKVFK